MKLRARRSPGLRRFDGAVTVTFTVREARSAVRAIDLVVNDLRAALFANKLPGGLQPPMVDAHEVLVAACERAGVDIRRVA